MSEFIGKKRRFSFFDDNNRKKQVISPNIDIVVFRAIRSIAETLVRLLSWEDAVHLSLVIPGMGIILKEIFPRIFIDKRRVSYLFTEPRSKGKIINGAKYIRQCLREMEIAAKGNGSPLTLKKLRKQVQQSFVKYQTRMITDIEWNDNNPSLEYKIRPCDDKWGYIDPKPHQKRAFVWLREVESKGSISVDSFDKDGCLLSWPMHPDGFYDPHEFSPLKTIRVSGGLYMDGLGMGKTAVMAKLCVTEFNHLCQSTLVCVPNYLCGQWRREIMRVAGKGATHRDFISDDQVVVIQSRDQISKKYEESISPMIYIVSHKVFSQKPKEGAGKGCLLKCNIHRVVIDEVELLFNKRIDYALGEIPSVAFRWCITSTPLKRVNNSHYRKLFDFFNGKNEWGSRGTEQIGASNIRKFMDLIQSRYWRTASEKAIDEENVLVKVEYPIEMNDLNSYVYGFYSIAHKSRVSRSQLLSRNANGQHERIRHSFVREVTSDKLDRHMRHLSTPIDYCYFAFPFANRCGGERCEKHDNQVYHFSPSSKALFCAEHFPEDQKYMYDPRSYIKMFDFAKGHAIAKLLNSEELKGKKIVVCTKWFDANENIKKFLNRFHRDMMESKVEINHFSARRSNRTKVMRNFNNELNDSILVVNPEREMKGLDLSKADVMLFTEPLVNALVSDQIESTNKMIKKMNNVGQTRGKEKLIIIMYYKNTEEEVSLRSNTVLSNIRYKTVD